MNYNDTLYILFEYDNYEYDSSEEEVPFENEKYVREIYRWSSRDGYLVECNAPNSSCIEVTSMNELLNALTFSDATLFRLSKATGYNYLADGRYTMTFCDCKDTWYMFPKHWTTGYKPVTKLRDSTVRILENGETIIARNKNTFTIEYICSIGIPLTSAIMQIADITIVTEN